MESDNLFTVSQVSLLLKVHPLTIRRYIKEGKLKAVKVGGNIRVPQSSIDQFANSIQPTNYPLEKRQRAAPGKSFSLTDPIFRLKGIGLSFRPI